MREIRAIVTIVVMCLTGLSGVVACQSGSDGGDDGGGDGDGRDAFDEDADLEYDGGDEAPADESFSCDLLTSQEIGLFQRVFVPGASNTPGCSSDPCDLDSMRDHYAYYARVLVQAWEHIQDCTDYQPVAAVYNRSGDMTLALSVDVFFHNTHGSLEGFESAVQDYLDSFRSDYPELPFIVPNVPESMISGSDDPAAYNASLAEFVAVDQDLHLLDLDHVFNKILAGKVEYDGVILSTVDVLMDPVHLNDFGHLLVAELLIVRLNEIFPALDIPSYGELVIMD